MNTILDLDDTDNLNTLSFLKIEARPPILKSFSDRCTSFIACVVTEGILVSETKNLLDRYVPLSSSLAHLSRVKKITLATKPLNIVWYLLVCPENEFLTRMASETASSTPSLSTRSTPSTTDEEPVNVIIPKSSSLVSSVSLISSDSEHPSFLTSLVNESGSNSILRSLSRFAAGGFFKTSVCVVPNQNKDEFKRESESSWPMMWFVPKGTQPSLTKSITPSPPPSSSLTKEKTMTAVDRAYFMWGLRRAFQCSKNIRDNSKDTRGCIIARQVFSISKEINSLDHKDIDALHSDGASSPLLEHIVEGSGNSAVLLEEGAGGSEVVVDGFDPTQTAVMRAIDCVAESHRKREGENGIGSQPRTLPSSRGGREGESGDVEQKNHVNVGVKRRRELTDSATFSLLPFSLKDCSQAQQYICTGLDAFLTHEPDLFDAMALLHSRVSRVIYGLPDDIAGAIGGLDDLDVVDSTQQSDQSNQTEDVMKERTQKFRRPSLRLQEVRALNHHYTVYRMFTR